MIGTAVPDELGPASMEQPPSRVEVAALLIVCALFAVAVWAIISVPAPLGHDESVYALQGRALLTTTPPAAISAIEEHRAPLLGAMGTLPQLVTTSERALRLITLAFGLVALTVAWFLVRASGVLGAVLAAAAIAVVPAVQRGAAFFLTDLPAAVLVLLAAAILWRQMEMRSAPTYLLPAAGAALAGAFYLRYGSVLPIGLVALTAAVLWWQRWLHHWKIAVLTAGLALALTIPHFVNAQVAFGTPWGRVLHTAEAVATYAVTRDRPVGFSTYMGQFPQAIPGYVATASLAVTSLFVVVCLVRFLSRRRVNKFHRLGLLLGVPGLIHIVVMTATTHAEDRFLLPGILLTTAAAGVAANLATARLGAKAPWLSHAGIAALALLLLTLCGPHTARTELASRERFGETNKPVKLLAIEVGKMASDECTVVTGYQPQVAWYSGCKTSGFGSDPAALMENLREEGVFLVFFDTGKRQPDEADRDSYLALTDGQPVATVDGVTDSRLEPAEAYRLEPGRGATEREPLDGRHGFSP